MIRSLYSKFLIFTIIIMIGSALIAFLTVNTFYHQQLKEDNDTKNVKIAENIAHYLEHNGLDENFLETTAQTGYKLIFVSDNNNISFYGDDFRENNLSATAIETVLDGHTYHGMRDFPKETFVTGFFSDETANTVGVPVTVDNESYALFIRPNIKLLFTEVHYLLGGMFITMAVVSLLAMLFIARKLVQPLSKLTKATEKIGQEQFHVQLPADRGDEIGQLAKSFQKMTKQLQQSDQMRKQFINDVSHDFQTPLQNIQGYANLLQEEPLSPEEKQAYTSIIKNETERLSALTKQLLLLTSLETMQKSIQKEYFSLHDQLKNVVNKYRWWLIEKNISLTLEMDEITFYGSEQFIENIWENLLSNALKYGKENGNILIRLEKINNQVIITFQDDGIGIEDNKVNYLFDRFYRVDSSRQSTIEGTGLGLSIVKEVIDLHDGSIQVKSELGKGTSFIIHLPIL